MQRLSVGVWHSGPVKAAGHRQRGPRWPDTQVPPFLQFRVPQERELYSQEEPVKPYRDANGQKSRSMNNDYDYYLKRKSISQLYSQVDICR